jgi:hypothetical protein
MLEGVELVSRYIAQYAKVEELYIHRALAQQEPLEKSITDLYTAILTYLTRATQYYDEGRASELLQNVRSCGPVVNMIRPDGTKCCAWLFQCG